MGSKVYLAHRVGIRRRNGSQLKEANMKKTASIILLAFALLSVHAASLVSAQEGKIVPYVPTPQEVVDRMLELAQVKAGDVVYDLGSGDGRIVVTAAKKYGVKAIGFEIDP